MSNNINNHQGEAQGLLIIDRSKGMWPDLYEAVFNRSMAEAGRTMQDCPGSTIDSAFKGAIIPDPWNVLPGIE